MAVKPGRKVLVAVGDEAWRAKVRQAVLDAGLEPVTAATGREAIQKLRAKGEIEAVLLDSTLPMPGLAPLLAQLRADVDVGRIPILLAAVPETRASHDLANRYHALRDRLGRLNDQTMRYRAALRVIDNEEAEERKEVEKNTRAFSTKDRTEAMNRVMKKYEDRRRLAALEDPLASSLIKDQSPLDDEMAVLAKRYDLESRVRENALAPVHEPIPQRSRRSLRPAD